MKAFVLFNLAQSEILLKISVLNLKKNQGATESMGLLNFVRKAFRAVFMKRKAPSAVDRNELEKVSTFLRKNFSHFLMIFPKKNEYVVNEPADAQRESDSVIVSSSIFVNLFIN